MHVLVLPKWYPGRNDPQLGDFIRKQMLAVSALHQISVVYPCPVKNMAVAYEEVLEQTDGAWELRCYYRPSLSGLALLRKALNYARYKRALRSGTQRALRERGRPDLIHAHILTRPVYAAWRLAKRWGIPFLISEQSSGHLNGTWGRRPRLAKALDRFLVQKAVAVVAVSPYLAKALEVLHPPHPVAVVPNVLPISPTPPGPPGPAGHFLMVADLVDRIKNVGGVLRALRLAKNQGHEFNLEVIGDGPDRAMLERMGDVLELAGWVTWHGRLPNTAVLEHIARAGTVIINSPVETFSVVTGEALALGRPVIATRCGGPEAFITPANGLLIAVGDDRALAEAMITLWRDHGNYAPERVKATVGGTFSKEAVAARLDAVYKQAAGHG